MPRIVANTDVLLGEVRYPKGTKFAIVDAPKPGTTPVEVDAATASRWLRDRWADPLADTPPVKTK